MNKETEKENKILTGVIWKQLLIFFFPILIGTFFQQMYNTVDAVVVGRFAGKEALSSVGGSAGQLINLVVGFFTGLTAGGTVLISQYYGAKQKLRLDDALHTAYAFSIVGGILLGIIETFAKAYLSTQFSDAIVFGVLIIILLVKPAGLLGKQIQEKV